MCSSPSPYCRTLPPLRSPSIERLLGDGPRLRSLVSPPPRIPSAPPAGRRMSLDLFLTSFASFAVRTSDLRSSGLLLICGVAACYLSSLRHRFVLAATTSPNAIRLLPLTASQVGEVSEQLPCAQLTTFYLASAPAKPGNLRSQSSPLLVVFFFKKTSPTPSVLPRPSSFPADCRVSGALPSPRAQFPPPPQHPFRLHPPFSQIEPS